MSLGELRTNRDTDIRLSTNCMLLWVLRMRRKTQTAIVWSALPRLSRTYIYNNLHFLQTKVLLEALISSTDGRTGTPASGFAPSSSWCPSCSIAWCSWTACRSSSLACSSSCPTVWRHALNLQSWKRRYLRKHDMN